MIVVGITALLAVIVINLFSGARRNAAIAVEKSNVFEATKSIQLTSLTKLGGKFIQLPGPMDGQSTYCTPPEQTIADCNSSLRSFVTIVPARSSTLFYSTIAQTYFTPYFSGTAAGGSHPTYGISLNQAVLGKTDAYVYISTSIDSDQVGYGSTDRCFGIGILIPSTTVNRSSEFDPITGVNDTNAYNFFGYFDGTTVSVPNFTQTIYYNFSNNLLSQAILNDYQTSCPNGSRGFVPYSSFDPVAFYID
jgi:hypothetical protein